MSANPRLQQVSVFLSAVATVLFIISAAIQWAEGSFGRALFVSGLAVLSATIGYVRWRGTRWR